MSAVKASAMRSAKYIGSCGWILLLSLASSVSGGFDLMQGDLIRLNQGPGSPAGTYRIDASSSDFDTFCVELTEHVKFGTTYYVNSISSRTDQGNNQLGEQAAWLYTQFLDKNSTKLVGFDFSSPASANEQDRANIQADALQLGIWQGMAIPYITADIVSLSGWSEEYISGTLSPLLGGWLEQFRSDVDAQRWSGTGDIQVISLRKFEYDENGPIALSDGQRIKLKGYAQDQLVRMDTYPNPELPSFYSACAVFACAAVWASVAFVRKRRLSLAT
jgi:hypothetical protein